MYLSHPGIRQAAAGVKGWQQSEAQVFGHMQELILVPLHVLTSLLQHHSHGVPSQQTSERTNAHIKNGMQQNPNYFLSLKSFGQLIAAYQRVHFVYNAVQYQQILTTSAC